MYFCFGCCCCLFYFSTCLLLFFGLFLCVYVSRRYIFFCKQKLAYEVRISYWSSDVCSSDLALTVVVPVILLRTASIDSMQAMEQVNHSQQVEAQSYALIYDLRNVEAAALAIAAGVDARELPDRIEQSRERIAPALDTLQALTRDNPDQQVRIGVLRTNVELRMDEVDRMIAGTSNAASVERLVTRYPGQGNRTEEP